MPTYAKDTSVSSQQSCNEIERTLERYGATKFMYGIEDARAMIAFELDGVRYRFTLVLPHLETFRYTESRALERAPAAQRAAYEQAIRQRWRALALIIKATLEAVEAGIVTLQDAFLSHVVLPDNTTVGERMLPQLRQIASTGTLPPLLPAPKDGD